MTDRARRLTADEAVREIKGCLREIWAAITPGLLVIVDRLARLTCRACRA